MAEHSRPALAQFLRAIGARRADKPLNSVALAETLQPTVQVDDLAQLAIPFPVARAWFRLDIGQLPAGGAGTLQGVRIRARAGGVWLGTVNFQGAIPIAVQIAADAANRPTVFTPLTRVGPAFASLFSFGAIAQAAPAVGTFVLPAQNIPFALDLFVPAGRIIDITSSAQNTAITGLHVEVQEVPTNPTP